MNALVKTEGGALAHAGDPKMALAEVLQHVQLVQQVLREVMVKDVHYGTIPGTDKPTLYQAGADVLAMVFRIAPEIETEDLSTADVIRYRVKVRGRHQLTGIVLGEGVGECSGAEEKYRWRRAVSDDEYDDSPATLRRIKYGKSYKAKQIRTEPADAANTVLKMATKRAKLAMILNVTGASAVFGQDLEDLPEELREAFTGRARPPGGDGQGQQQQAPAVWPADLFDKQLPRWTKAVAEGLKTPDDIIAWAVSKGPLTPEQEATIRALRKAGAETVEDATPAPAPAPTEAAAPAPAPAPAADDTAPWVDDMNAAEAAQQKGGDE